MASFWHLETKEATSGRLLNTFVHDRLIFRCRDTNATCVQNHRVHSLSTLEKLTYQEAHDTEILAIDFTDSLVQGSPVLVATAGRDRLLHVFDVLNDYALVQTLDDHSSSITCIKFAADGSRMMSCGADKSIIFRNCQKVNDRCITGYT
jgi:WD40 repeat protein